jgi:hypothetical protein
MKPDLHDILTLAGAALLCAGVWSIYPPAALILAGAALAAVGVVGRPGAPPPSPDDEVPV